MPFVSGTALGDIIPSTEVEIEIDILEVELPDFPDLGLKSRTYFF